MALQVIQNNKGKPTGVYIPIKQWNTLKKQYRELEVLENEEPTKEQIIEGIKQAVQEMKMMKAGKLKTRPLKALLDEL